MKSPESSDDDEEKHLKLFLDRSYDEDSIQVDSEDEEELFFLSEVDLDLYRAITIGCPVGVQQSIEAGADVNCVRVTIPMLRIWTRTIMIVMTRMLVPVP